MEERDKASERQRERDPRAASRIPSPRSADIKPRATTNIGGGDVQPYVKSQTLAERAARDFIAGEEDDRELSVVNPVGRFRADTRS
jgi:hypothetical protein